MVSAKHGGRLEENKNVVERVWSIENVGARRGESGMQVVGRLKERRIRRGKSTGGATSKGIESRSSMGSSGRG